MDVRPPLVAYAQPPTVGKPGQRPLHHPAVPTQPLARIDASPGYARLYAPLPERLSAAGEIVALIGMDLIRPPSWYSARGPDRFDALYESLADVGVVDVGPGQDHRERQTLTVDQEMALGARPTSVYRVRTGFLAPDLFNVPGNLAVRDRRVLRDVAGSLVAPCRPSGGWLEKGLRSGRVRRVGWLNRGLL